MMNQPIMNIHVSMNLSGTKVQRLTEEGASWPPTFVLLVACIWNYIGVNYDGNPAVVQRPVDSCCPLLRVRKRDNKFCIHIILHNVRIFLVSVHRTITQNTLRLEEELVCDCVT
jgi:hypothetical protein